jgi:hypothetical protein
MTSSLYDTDYNQWTQDTIQQIQNRDFESIDWDSLIEELEIMGKNDKRALISLLTRVLEHLLKLSYWESENQDPVIAGLRKLSTFALKFKDVWKIVLVLILNYKRSTKKLIPSLLNPFLSYVHFPQMLRLASRKP